MARHQITLQTNGSGGSVGNPATLADHGHFQRYLWAIGETSIRWDSLSHFHLHGSSTLAVICLRINQFKQQPDQQPKPDQQGLLPASDHSTSLHISRRDGFCHRLSGPARPNGLLPYRSHRGYFISASLFTTGSAQCFGGRYLAVGVERGVSRRALYCAIPYAVL